MTDKLSSLAIIGGSGLYSLVEPAPEQVEIVRVRTPYSTDAVPVYLERTETGPVAFLPRHGREHTLAPHEINYRANLWALQQLGVRKVIAVNAVGGISPLMQTGALMLPDQLIDYTWGREHTYFSGAHGFDRHIDFTWPYDPHLAEVLLQAGLQCGLDISRGGVYACTQGPRLETAAEIRKLAADGCDVVGMTGMPEAALARELALDYASLCFVVNRAAGLDSETVSIAAIEQVLARGMGQVRKLLLSACALLLAGQGISE